MAIEYKTTSTKAELIEIAVTNGIDVDDNMTKAQIIAALDAYNAAEDEKVSAVSITPITEDPPTQEEENGTSILTTENPTLQEEQDVTTTLTTEDPPTQNESDYNMDEYDMFVYAGPSLPGGKLKENAVFRGTFDDVLKYLSDVIEKYPQVEKLIVPTHKFAVFSAKVKAPGNIVHKYYNDIVSSMHKHKEV